VWFDVRRVIKREPRRQYICLATAALNAVTKSRVSRACAPILFREHRNNMPRFFRSTSSGLSGRERVIFISGNGVRFADGSLLLTAAAANPAPPHAAAAATTSEESGSGENGNSRLFVQTFDGAILSFGSALRVPNVTDRGFLRRGDDVDDGALV
jgi:hypothetical protein